MFQLLALAIADDGTVTKLLFKSSTITLWTAKISAFLALKVPTMSARFVIDTTTRLAVVVDL